MPLQQVSTVSLSLNPGSSQGSFREAADESCQVFVVTRSAKMN
jgi:hypothetical protein